MTDNNEDILQTPFEIRKTLRPFIEKMNDYSEGPIRPDSYKRALEIQRLQDQLEQSMKVHIGVVPDPGKIKLIKQFP